MEFSFIVVPASRAYRPRCETKVTYYLARDRATIFKGCRGEARKPKPETRLYVLCLNLSNTKYNTMPTIPFASPDRIPWLQLQFSVRFTMPRATVKKTA